MITMIQMITSKPSSLKKPKPLTPDPPLHSAALLAPLHTAHGTFPYRYMWRHASWIGRLPVFISFLCAGLLFL